MDPPPERICFAHHGQFTGDIPGLLRTARDQLERWVNTVDGFLRRETGGDIPPAGQELDEFLPRIADLLRKVDPRFARGVRLPEDIQERERDFTRQTLRGMLGYLATDRSG